jgi:hypothetical protein
MLDSGRRSGQLAAEVMKSIGSPTAMTAESAVKAETFEGMVVILQRGFESRFEAEDHRVTMSRWKRVWIERVETAQNEGR